MRALGWVVAGVVGLLGSGCAGTKVYFADRARDFGEMFRVQAGLGVGLGASAQAGPVGHVGLGGGATLYNYGVGWTYGRGYAFGLGGADLLDVELYWPATLMGDGSGQSLGEGWHYAADRAGRRDVNARTHVCYGLLPGLFAREPDGAMLWTPRGVADNRWGHVHSWDLEAGVYAGFVSLRVGFSPGEFVDFVLGWFLIDIAGDDRRGRDPPDAPHGP